MACVSMPFAAQTALVRAQLQQGLEMAVVWALKAGLLEVRASVWVAFAGIDFCHVLKRYLC